MALPDQSSCLAGGWIWNSGSQPDFRTPSTPLFIPQIYNLQSSMKPPSRRVKTAQFSVYLEALGKSDQFEAPREKKNEEKHRLSGKTHIWDH